MLVCRAEGVLGEPFRAKRVAVQGGPVSSTIFNVGVLEIEEHGVYTAMHS